MYEVHMTPSVDLKSGQIIVENMSGKFQNVNLCVLKKLSQEFQLHTSSSGRISKGLFDVLLSFFCYCCDFCYFHVYS